ncbi:MAG TPA: (Fe-S)-binding protein [Xanthobacteraceae bacterium]|jgi:heterodisulfide reductase subunit D|nr:(Fe-S)-binding protein [Xanthobacteraceae bacterium]
MTGATQSETFESALKARADAMADACTRCGKCVEVCPATEAAGLTVEERQNPVEVISGIIDIVRGEQGNDAAAKWASGCLLSGECIKACDYGVNPRFMLYMARIAMSHAKKETAVERRAGFDAYRLVARDVAHISQIQLDDALLARLGQAAKGKAPRAPDAKPDFVFYTGCNVLKTPHIALLALDVMDALDVTYEVMGGPSHCCGIVQMRMGDVTTSGRMGESSIDKLSQSKNGEVLSWCPSCQVQFTETTLPTVEKLRGAKPFEMTPFTLFVHKNLERLRPLLREPVPMRIALHRHPGVRGVVEAAEEILWAVPGIEIVDLDQPAVGLQSNNLRMLPEFRKQLQQAELAAAEAAGVDALVAVYHSDHRELCAHERDYPFRIMNIYEIVGASMGIHYDDHYKRLKIMQDADTILADCADLVEKHGLDPATTKLAIQAMLDEQPAPLRGP